MRIVAFPAMFMVGLLLTLNASLAAELLNEDPQLVNACNLAVPEQYRLHIFRVKYGQKPNPNRKSTAYAYTVACINPASKGGNVVTYGSNEAQFEAAQESAKKYGLCQDIIAHRWACELLPRDLADDYNPPAACNFDKAIYKPSTFNIPNVGGGQSSALASAGNGTSTPMLGR